MVREHRERQSAECMEDSIWRQHLPVQGVVVRPELRHLGGRQIHRDGVGRQEGHRLRGHLLGPPASCFSRPLPRRRLLPRRPHGGLQRAEFWETHILGINGDDDLRILFQGKIHFFSLHSFFFFSFEGCGFFFFFFFFFWLFRWRLVSAAPALQTCTDVYISD